MFNNPLNLVEEVFLLVRRFFGDRTEIRDTDVEIRFEHDFSKSNFAVLSVNLSLSPSDKII